LSPQPDDTAETMNYRYGAMGQDVINELKGRRAISSPEQQKNIDDEIKQWEPIANLAQSGGNPSGSAEKAEQTRTGSAPDYSNLWN
jgi:putative heme iron utilization protein